MTTDPIGFDRQPVDATIVPAHVTAVLIVRPELPGGFPPAQEPIARLEVTGSPALIAVEDEPLR